MRAFGTEHRTMEGTIITALILYWSMSKRLYCPYIN